MLDETRIDEMYNDKTWILERKARYRALEAIYLQIGDHTHGDHLQPEELKVAHIQTVPLSLDGAGNLQPQYFAKYDKEIPYALERIDLKDSGFTDLPPTGELFGDSWGLALFLRNHFNGCSYYISNYQDTMRTSFIHEPYVSAVAFFFSFPFSLSQRHGLTLL